MSATDPLEGLRDAIASARSGHTVAQEIQRRVAELNTSFADAAALGLKVEITAEETFLNALEDAEARAPVWRIKCTVYEELGK